MSFAQCMAAILANSLGRYADALAAAQQASEDTPELYVSMWALPELIEAAGRWRSPGCDASPRPCTWRLRPARLEPVT